ncbi:hypothetical protein K435DRAFT_974900 [Dendrothele bispora CBS 962.96]|uniref:Uncharacterized protein n=1 Tax=Dendrothele bispora (strain CBS 962.96) TaxID=1314807 RepID=A0A4S8KIL7_DENBC|nr:hypothetical protein K435DRAFT_974900 [Dendrothele bispora CBS 962.96]
MHFSSRLVYAGPPANAYATLGILLQLYLSRNSTLKYQGTPRRWTVIAVNTAPPVLWAMVFTGSLIYGIVNPQLVQRDLTGMYCNISSSVPSSVGAALVALLSVTMIIFEIMTLVLLFKNWTAFRRLQVSTSS